MHQNNDGGTQKSSHLNNDSNLSDCEEAESSAIFELLKSFAEAENELSRLKYQPLYDELFSINPPSPRGMNLHFRMDRKKKSSFAKIAVEKLGIPKGEQWKAQFIYKEYSFLSRFLSELIKQLEGGACSVDKTGGIVQVYLRNLKGTPPEYEQQEWNIPRIDTLNAWIELIDSLILFHGAYDLFQLPMNLETLKKSYQ